MNQLKIGVLTFHRCINYGSYWQARCLVDGLIKRGHNAILLDHESKRVNIAEWKCAFQPLLPLPELPEDRPLYRKKIKSFFKAFDKLPLSPRFPLDEPGQTPACDVVVVGSDEVWNLTHPWYGSYPVFYGEGIPAKNLVSYAASFGNYPATWGLDETRRQQFQRFNSISVRDENSQSLVANATGKQPEMVLDPCLQFDLVPEPRNIPFEPGTYVAVYGHNFSEAFISKAKTWAEKTQVKLVSIGYRNHWANEQWIDADPHEFVHFITGAKAVLTNFFHGCIFSLRFQKSFVSETSFYRSTKIQGLMNKVGGNNHLVYDATPQHQFEACLNQPIDSNILERIQQLRTSSNLFLDSALSLHKPATHVQPV